MIGRGLGSLAVTTVDLARIQFATTTLYHFLFVPLSAEHVADVLRVNRPVHSELELLDEPCHYALSVMSVVALIFVPIVLLYQGWTYYVFRRRLGGGASPAA